MQNFFTPKPMLTLMPTQAAVSPAGINPIEAPIGDFDLQFIAEAAGYKLDESEDGLGELNGDDCNSESGKHNDTVTAETNLENQTEPSSA